jgi:7-dehydrocholesterol reductase
MSNWLRTTLIPAALILFSPPMTLLVWHTHVRHHGSIMSLMTEFAAAGVLGTVAGFWGPVFFGSPIAWTMIVIFAAVQLTLMRLLPGRAVRAPITPGGNIPVYKANGVPAFVVTLGLYLGCSFGLGLFPAAIICDHFGELLGALNIFSLVFCVFLYLKGRTKPSTSDNRHSGNFIFDYFWGTELHPRVLSWDVKMFTNCRFGMMGWPLILISFAAAQFARHGNVSPSMAAAVGIQLLYIAKFFYWESGYLQSMDITHDRAGFYICWGCLVWLPSIYTSSTLYLVDQTRSVGVAAALLIFAAGAAAVIVNYSADAQRRRVRDTHGKTKVWGKPPILLIARYTTARGERCESILLASGWWGVARHFHYLPEFLAALFWTLPVLFENALPYFYLAFLAILLIHRAFRDDTRCGAKYGPDWDAYRRAVPWRIIPGVI